MDKTLNRPSLNKRSLIYVVLAGAVAAGLTIVYQSPWFTPGKPMQVSGISMQPTLQPGDQVRLRKDLDYTNGDLVAIQFPSREHPMVKRVIALPGDTLEFVEGKVKLNGSILETNWWPAGKKLAPQSYQVLANQLKHYGNSIPENNVIVMGDNASKSYDSGKYGMLSADRIIGRIDAPSQDKKLAAWYQQPDKKPVVMTEDTAERELPAQQEAIPQETAADEDHLQPVFTEQMPRNAETVKANELNPQDRDPDHKIDPNFIAPGHADIQDAV